MQPSMGPSRAPSPPGVIRSASGLRFFFFSPAPMLLFLFLLAQQYVADGLGPGSPYKAPTDFKYRSLTSWVIVPGLPVPTSRPSTLVTGVTPPSVPVTNASSAE